MQNFNDISLDFLRSLIQQNSQQIKPSQEFLQSLLNKQPAPPKPETSKDETVDPLVQMLTEGLEELFGSFAQEEETAKPKPQTAKSQRTVKPSPTEAKQSKTRGSIAITFEQLAKVLRLPEGVEIVATQEDFEREILNLKLISKEKTSLTNKVTEASRIKSY